LGVEKSSQEEKRFGQPTGFDRRNEHEKDAVLGVGPCFNGDGGVVVQRERSAGEDVTATITGTITDASGAALAGASVTAKDMDRGTVWPATTNTEAYKLY